jgi:hypothetical protein
MVCVAACHTLTTVTGSQNVGGLVGYNYGRVEQSHSSGVVSGDQNVGGLVGSNHNLGYYGGSSITKCYSTNEVIGIKSVGGLLGYNPGGYSPARVHECYSTGAVSGIENVGGLVGYGYGGVTSGFWDIETSGQSTSAGGTGKTTAEMKTASTFYIWYECGQEPVWTIDEGNDCPRLYWEDRHGQVIKPVSLSDFLSGDGTKDNPFRIYTAEELDLVGMGRCDWDKHFKLMADIDLSGYSYDAALIAPDIALLSTIWDFQGTPFTGIFDGNGHTISNLTITGENYLGLFGQLDAWAIIKNLKLEAVNIKGTGDYIGGLVGSNSGSITTCSSTGTVNGDDYVGGLVGLNGSYGIINTSYSTSRVNGDHLVGGLIGYNYDSHTFVTMSYSVGRVTGNSDVGGLLGNNDGDVTQCFWDIQTSGQTKSAGGNGKTTAEMQTASTFLEAGWDFVDEVDNGTDDIWWINEGQDYPRLWWEAEDN